MVVGIGQDEKIDVLERAMMALLDVHIPKPVMERVVLTGPTRTADYETV